MPTYSQIRSIGSSGSGTTYVSDFSPVLGGAYRNGSPYVETGYGLWWSAEAYDGAARRYLNYNGTRLNTISNGGRYFGFYIRCVSEEKTATDLTYMQDMTPQTSFWTLVNGRSYDEV